MILLAGGYQRGRVRYIARLARFELPEADTRDLTVCSFDDPSGFGPTYHVAIDWRLGRWRVIDHLSCSRIDENPNVVDRSIRATASPA